MSSLPLPLLSLVFLAAAGGVWWAGIHLSETTDVLDRRFGWGDALGGLVLLTIATNLPEIAIVSSAALGGNVALATGNLLGGIAIQTVVLALLDVAGGGDHVPLTSRTTTLVPAIEASIVIMGMTLLLLGSQVDSVTVLRVEPTGVLIFLIWVVGLLLVRRATTGLAWQLDQQEQGEESDEEEAAADRSTARTIAVFAVAAVLTLIGGVVLERSSDAIAADLGVGSAIFGATVLAVATAIPEISTGLQSVKQGDHQLAISDIFGGNAFLPTLFLLMALLSGKAVVARMASIDMYLAALGIILTCVYLVGLVFRSGRIVLRMGYDSLLVLLVYLVGVAALVVYVA